jgi:hypothetical protein
MFFQWILAYFSGFQEEKAKIKFVQFFLNLSLLAKNHIPGLGTHVPYAIFCSGAGFMAKYPCPKAYLININLSSQVKGEVWREAGDAKEWG